MAARPRIRRRANWPDNLHEPRPGYFTWRDTRDGKTHVLGRIALAQAIHEAIEANMVVAQSAARQTLADKLKGSRTVSDLIGRVSTKGLKPSTIDGRNSCDNAIKDKIGTRDCSTIKTDELSDMLDAIVARGTVRMAQAIRSRMMDIFAVGVAIGWIEKNPAAVTLPITPEVRRKRLTIEQFNAILEKAPQVADWLPNAMLLALVSGQDRSTIGSWERAWVKDGIATVFREKTQRSIAIPVALRMDAIGVSLEDVITKCKSTNVVSKYLIHHVRNVGAAKRGDPIRHKSITKAFSDARKLAEIPDANAPTLHEIRSLSKRIYDEEGRVDTKALLGHSTDAMANLYADNRGIEPIKVRISAA
jgi:hypothetical protein